MPACSALSKVFAAREIKQRYTNTETIRSMQQRKVTDRPQQDNVLLPKLVVDFLHFVELLLIALGLLCGPGEAQSRGQQKIVATARSRRIIALKQVPEGENTASQCLNVPILYTPYGKL